LAADREKIDELVSKKLEHSVERGTEELEVKVELVAAYTEATATHVEFKLNELMSENAKLENVFKSQYNT